MRGTAACLILFVSAEMGVKAYKAVAGSYPCVNDDLQKTLLWVKNSTESDAIINCWWDAGALYKAVSERRVIFDGQNQNDIVAYWFARALLSDEEEAEKILRMLNNSSYGAHEEIRSITGDDFKSYVILNDLIESDSFSRRRILENHGFGTGNIDKLLSMLGDAPSSAYLVLEKSLMAKMPFVSFMGNWSFEKLYMLRNIGKPDDSLKAYLAENFKMSSSAAKEEITRLRKEKRNDEVYDELSKPYLFYSTPAKGTKKGNTVFFENGLAYNVKTKHVKLRNPEENYYSVPGRVIISDGKRTVRLSGPEYEKTSAGQKVYWIYKTNNNYFSITLDEPLIDTLFSKLMFLGCDNLKYFKEVYSDRRNGIYVYKIQWR